MGGYKGGGYAPLVAGSTGSTGSTGATGARGPVGGWTIEYQFSTDVTAPPAAGYVELNNATVASVTHLFASDTDRHAESVQDTLDEMAAGDYLRLFRTDGTAGWATFEITAISDAGTYHDMTVTYLDDGGAFILDGTVGLAFAPVGVQGTQGTVGAQGTKGDQGTQGTVGAQGTKGDQGTQGTVGAQGTKGDQGTQGTVGAQGNKGDQGTQGTKGDTGARELKALKGTPGIRELKARRATPGTRVP